MKRTAIKFMLLVLMAMPFFTLSAQTTPNPGSTVVKKGPKYDTIIRKHQDKPVVKAKPPKSRLSRKLSRRYLNLSTNLVIMTRQETN
jgi:hypothetical protein